MKTLNLITDNNLAEIINLFLLAICSPSSHSIVVIFIPVGLLLLTRHSQQPIGPVENAALTTKGLQERKQLLSGTTVKNR